MRINPLGWVMIAIFAFFTVIASAMEILNRHPNNFWVGVVITVFIFCVGAELFIEQKQ